MDEKCHVRGMMRLTFTASSSKSILMALRTSYSSPCISKHMLLNTTSAFVAAEICLMILVTWVGVNAGGGNNGLNWAGNSQKDAT